MTALHLSQHLPTTSWQLWGQRVFPSFGHKPQTWFQNGYPALKAQRRQRPHCSLGLRSPAPNSQDFPCKTPGDRRASFPGLGDLWVKKSWDMWSLTFLKCKELSAPR